MKASAAKAAVSVAAESVLDEMEGGSEVYHASMAAGTLAKPAVNAASAGRNLYRSQAVTAKQKRIRRQQSESRIREKAAKESSLKTAGKKAQAVAKKAAKETVNIPMRRPCCPVIGNCKSASPDMRFHRTRIFTGA